MQKCKQQRVEMIGGYFRGDLPQWAYYSSVAYTNRLCLILEKTPHVFYQDPLGFVLEIILTEVNNSAVLVSSFMGSGNPSSFVLVMVFCSRLGEVWHLRGSKGVQAPLERHGDKSPLGILGMKVQA